MGDVIQFPGAGSQAPGRVPETDDSDYPYRVYPMSVTKTVEDQWSPLPATGWGSMEILRWWLGLIRFQTRVPVQVRSAGRSGGPYLLRIGDRPTSITHLTDTRALYILMGIFVATEYLEEFL